MTEDRSVTLAAITGAHGVAGEVRLKLFAGGVDALRRHAGFNHGALALQSLRDDGKGGAIARIVGVADRTAAERLRGTALTVPRSALPPLAEGEYYHADLLDLPVVTPDGAAVGRIVAVENFGAGDVIEIERPGHEGKRGARFMVPMNLAAVPEWDGARLVVNPAYVEA